MNRKTAFIGHRTIIDKNIRDLLFKEIKTQITKGCKVFTMGTHGEFDKLALSICRELRQTYNDIIIEVVITSLHSINKQLIYNDNFGKEYYEPYSDVQTVMYEIENKYFKRQIVVSNKKMIDTCDTLICYVDSERTQSGAKITMNYAKRKGVKIINLYSKSN